MLNKLLNFKKEIKFEKIVKKDNGYCKYGFENLFWLELVLKLLGFDSYREKINQLKYLEEENKLDIFYKNLGIQFKTKDKYGKNNYPCLATWSQYKRGIILEDYDYVKELESKINDLISSSENDINIDINTLLNKEDLLQISVDGKFIKNTHPNAKKSFKNINFVSNKQIIKSEKTENEARWIRDMFKSSTLDLKKN